MADAKKLVQPPRRTSAAPGPLVVSKANPRHFAVGSGVADVLSQLLQLGAIRVPFQTDSVP